MSEISRLATGFNERSRQQAECTEKVVKGAFEKHESALLAVLNESEKKTSDAIRAQSRNLQRTALKSWMAVVIPVSMTLLLGAGAMGMMGWYITGQINEIASRSATLDQLKREGGAIQLSHCGESRRLCIKIDESALKYQGGYRIPEGY